MRNLVYLNGDGMVNVYHGMVTVPINDEWYCEMTEEELQAWLKRVGCFISGQGQVVDGEDLYVYGTVLEIA